MEILKKTVLLFQFLYLADALKMKKQNQTTPTVNPKIDKFIEDDMEIKLNLNNHNNDKDLNRAQSEKKILKENSTVKNLDLTKKRNKLVTPKKTVDKSASQAIYLPLDLLLKNPKINGSNNTNASSKSRRNVTIANNPMVNYLKPKIDFCEDTMEAVDESISDFYSAIKTHNRTNKTYVKLDDVKVVDDNVNIKMSSPEISEVTDIDERSFPDTSYDKYNPSGNIETQKLIKTPTTIEILIKCEPSTPNEALRSNSSIVIHNTTYQEITQPTYCSSPYSYTPRWPYRSWYGTYPYNFYKYPYTKRNGHCYFYNTQYSMPYSAPNIVWKTWNNMDLSMTNPNYMTFNSEETKDYSTPEYDDNMYEINDQNVN
ncbi:putative mediator of RNA polymerase II transcription subunit 26 [Pieris brassicae]|uniref:putative mediator of RNA polymerase II transcription subunit 26 n=1 Tax=Pieris brassicae TaxID=7116 RepID=UPI001E661DD1|nr:putative mediator of RNA polymerase II transcription subunit 26 [Pieris brassicae]